MLLTITICLHVSCSSLDVRRRHIRFRGSQDLIADEEAAQVVILVEDVHDSLVSLVLALIPLRLRHARSLDVGIEGVQVEPDVDTGVSESLHAAIMVRTRIDVVDANGVGAQGLHQVGIAGTLVVVDERVVRQELVSDALCRWSVESIIVACSK